MHCDVAASFWDLYFTNAKRNAGKKILWAALMSYIFIIPKLEYPYYVNGYLEKSHKNKWNFLAVSYLGRMKSGSHQIALPDLSSS